MKKLILAIAAFAAMSISASAAEVTGSILSTDIGTLIDGAPCKTYNVDGRTFVIAEDLRGYGFDVVYDDSIRRLTITQNPYSERTILSKEEINIEKSSITVGQWLGDMFATDITVYLGDEQIEGYAIDGKMVIPVRALESCAYVNFSEKYKVVSVNGLQHYLTEQHNAGNTNITYNITENTVNLFRTNLDQYGNTIAENSESNEGISKIIIATDTSDGSITAYWGEPYEIYPNYGRYQSGHLYNAANYTIKDKQGNLLYDVQVSNSSFDRALDRLGYLRNNNIIIVLKGYSGNRMYFFEASQENSYYCYWPAEANPIFTHFSTNDKLLSESGCLYDISDDNIISLERYNIKDSYTRQHIDFYLSNDNKLYEVNHLFQFNNEVESIFDILRSENTVKYSFSNVMATLDLILTTDNTLYHQHQNKIIASSVKDFAAEDYSTIPLVAVLNLNNELYLGRFYEYFDNQAGLLSSDVNSIYMGDSELYYIKNNGELYSYSIFQWTTTKLADNIRKVVKDNLFITTNDELTDLTNIIATNVKDASNQYILTNDNTIISRTTGEQIFPK